MTNAAVAAAVGKVERLLHSLRNAGPERALRSLEKLREKRDLQGWMVEGLAELFQRFPSE